jgi:hypothetical protein
VNFKFNKDRITRNLINFNPNPEDLNDFCYVELIDTIGYDTGVKLQEYYEFFNVSLPVTRDMSKMKSIADKIRYQYRSNGDISNPGDCIMAYMFVFDYNDKKSLKDILVLAKEIKFQEKIRLNNQTHSVQINQKSKSPLETIKIFVANKCPFLVESDAPIQNKDKEIIYPIYKFDDTAEFYLNEILTIFDNHKEEAMENLFFVNARYNIGIDRVFAYMAKEVMQKEDLWKIPKYEENKNGKKDSNNLMDDVNQVSCFEMIFLCRCSKKNSDESSANEKDLNVTQSEENNVPILNETEDSNETARPDHVDNNTNKEQKNDQVNNDVEQDKKGVEEEKKSGGCIIM